MIGENINIENKKLRVLISPLDWGLGHATRIITIVKTLQKYDVQVLIAADGATATLLKTEFPELTHLLLKGYRVTYSRKKNNFFFKLIRQVPGIIATIKRENKWLKTIVKEQKIDAIISDNRFGLYHKKTPSVYITHQLFIETGNDLMSALAQKIHYKYINKFSECWVPDYEEGFTLAGKLSHPKNMPEVPVKYLGPLSRLKKEEVDQRHHILVLLSGPEPQRTIWENQLLPQLKKMVDKIILVRGLPASKEKLAPTETLKIYNHLPATDLGKLINEASLVIARSGYSTIMDLVALNKKAVLVPTPGQAEQEYLAVYLKEKKLFYTCSQQAIELEGAIKIAIDFAEQKSTTDFNSINEKVIKEWIDRLKEKK